MSGQYGFTPGLQVLLPNRQHFYPRLYNGNEGIVEGALGLKWVQKTKLNTIEEVRGSKIHPITGDTIVDKSTKTVIVPTGGIGLLVVKACVDLSTGTVRLLSEDAEDYEMWKPYRHTLHSDIQGVIATLLSGRCDFSELEKFIRRIGGQGLQGLKCHQRIDGVVCLFNGETYHICAALNHLIKKEKLYTDGKDPHGPVRV